MIRLSTHDEKDIADEKYSEEYTKDQLPFSGVMIGVAIGLPLWILTIWGSLELFKYFGTFS